MVLVKSVGVQTEEVGKVGKVRKTAAKQQLRTKQYVTPKRRRKDCGISSFCLGSRKGFTGNAGK